MEEIFKIIVNMDDEMFNIFQKSLEKEKYEIIERKEKILFVKKSNNILTDNQKSIILSIAKKQKVEGILFVDITSAVQYLIKIPEEKMKNDGQFSWMMRQSFLEAKLEKDKNCEDEKMEEYKKDLIKFVQTVQSISPVESYVTPYPWDMPGYDDKVIMAAGTFVGGSSIELSCDGPIREPYIAYLQGSLTYQYGKIGVLKAIESIKKY